MVQEAGSANAILNRRFQCRNSLFSVFWLLSDITLEISRALWQGIQVQCDFAMASSECAKPPATLVAYRDGWAHGRPLNIRCWRRRTSTPLRPQNRRRPPNTNRTHIPQSPNMASQSVQCFGKKKTATGTMPSPLIPIRRQYFDPTRDNG